MSRGATAGEARPLTKADIKALKTCNSLVMRYVETGASVGGAELISRIECIKRADDKDPWEQRHEIPVQTRCDSYQDGYRVEKACTVLFTYSWDVEYPVTTFVNLVREGDLITVRFVAASNSQLINEAGLFCDETNVTIHRGGKPKYSLLLESTIHKESSVRTCQMRRLREGEW